MSAPGVVRDRIASGQPGVAVELLEHKLSMQRPAARAVLRRMAAVGLLYKLRDGFWVGVPDEYREAGTPPAAWFVDDLMKSMGRPYYVGLTSAVEVHLGLSDRPRDLKVMTDRGGTHDIAYGPDGKLTIQFHASNALRTPRTRRPQRRPQPNTTIVKAGGSSLAVSTPAQTAYDLVRYLWCDELKLDVARALKALGPLVGKAELGTAFEAFGDFKRKYLATWQRVGCLLEILGFGAVTRELRERIWPLAHKEARGPLPLIDDGIPLRDPRELSHLWNVHVNVDLSETTSAPVEVDSTMGLPAVRKKHAYRRYTKAEVAAKHTAAVAAEKEELAAAERALMRAAKESRILVPKVKRKGPRRVTPR